MRYHILFKKIIALALALCFCAYSSGFAQVLPSVNPGVNFGQPPILKYLSVNSANPFNYFNFLLGVNPQAKENLGQEAKKLINYFFLGLTLPNQALWVNLRPDEPERIASEELAKTDMGRVLLEEDLQLKKDVAKYLHPANVKGKEFWEKLYTAIGKDKAKKIKIVTSSRVWIVPDEAVVVETEDGALVASAKLKVLSENEYLKENPQDQTQAITEKLMREIVLPALTDEINNGSAYAPLRQVYHSLILAEWFKRKHKSSASAFALSINRGYTNGLESELPWSKQKIWQEYVNSYQKSEYRLQDTVFGLRRMYWSGGIVMDFAGQSTPAGFSGPVTLGAGGATGGSVGTASPLKVMGLDDALKTPAIFDKIKADISGDSAVAVIGDTDSTFRNEMPRAELKLISVASSMKKNSSLGGQGPVEASAVGGRAAGKKISAPEDIFTALKPVLKYKPAELYFEDELPGLIVLEPAFGKVRALNFITAKYDKGEITRGEFAFLFAHELAELEKSDNTSVLQNIKNTLKGLFKPESEKIKEQKQKEHEMDWRAVELIENDGHSINDAISMLKKTPELFNEADKAGLIKGRIRDRETHPSIDERIEYVLSRHKERSLSAPAAATGVSSSLIAPANTAANYLLLPEASARLKQLNEWVPYSGFIIKNFEAGLISENFAKEEINAALPKIKASGQSGAYARILLDSLKKNLVPLDFAKKEILPLLVSFRQEGMWGAYIDTLKNALSRGVISSAGAREEAKVLAGLKQQKKYSSYYNILTELLEAEVIKNKDELDVYLKEAADKSEAYANVIFKARQKKIYSDDEARDAIREAAENAAQWKYAHASILIKSLEHNLFPRDYVKNAISQALAEFEGLELWGSYFNILIKALKNNLVDLGFAKEKSAIALKNIKDGDDFGLQVEPFFEAFDNGLISQERAHEEISVFLGSFKQRGLLNAYASTLAKALEKGMIGIDKGYLDKQKGFAERNNLSLSYIMKIRQLQAMADIPEGLIEAYIKEAKNILYRANEINNTEEKEDRQIDIKELAYYLNTGLANLQFISENIARQLTHNYLQRGYLPLLADSLGVFSKLEPEYASILNKFMSITGNKFINKPIFVQQLAGFAVAYKELGLNAQDYSADLNLELNESAIVGRLGKRLTQQIVSRFNIKVEIDEAEKAINQWDTSDLGILISAKEQWEAQDAEFFNLIFSLTLEGKFSSLVYPSDYSRLDISKFDGPTQELIKKIREYNQNFLNEAKRLNIDVDAWINPQNVIKPRVIQDSIVQRTAVDVLKDFRERFNQFKQLLAARKDLDKNNRIAQAERSLGPWGRVIDPSIALDSVKGVISEDTSNRAARLRRLSSLIAEIKKDLGQEGVPFQVAELEGTINEIMEFGPREKGFSGKIGNGYQIGFWQRAPNKDLFLANKAQTSTFLGSRSNKGRAIFEFLLDLGTLYAVVSNVKTNEPEGYVRLFLALNNNNEPSIFIDATDGIPTNANIAHVKEFINDFALKIGVKKENVFDKERGVINAKIGDALTERYLQQAGIATSGYLSESAGSPAHNQKAIELDSVVGSRISDTVYLLDKRIFWLFDVFDFTTHDDNEEITADELQKYVNMRAQGETDKILGMRLETGHMDLVDVAGIFSGAGIEHQFFRWFFENEDMLKEAQLIFTSGRIILDRDEVFSRIEKKNPDAVRTYLVHEFTHDGLKSLPGTDKEFLKKEYREALNDEGRMKILEERFGGIPAYSGFKNEDFWEEAFTDLVAREELGISAEGKLTFIKATGEEAPALLDSLNKEHEIRLSENKILHGVFFKALEKANEHLAYIEKLSEGKNKKSVGSPMAEEEKQKILSEMRKMLSLPENSGPLSPYAEYRRIVNEPDYTLIPERYYYAATFASLPDILTKKRIEAAQSFTGEEGVFVNQAASVRDWESPLNSFWPEFTAEGLAKTKDDKDIALEIVLNEDQPKTVRSIDPSRNNIRLSFIQGVDLSSVKHLRVIVSGDEKRAREVRQALTNRGIDINVVSATELQKELQLQSRAMKEGVYASFLEEVIGPADGGAGSPLSSEQPATKGGIDLSNIEITLKDEKYVSSLNSADQKALWATRAFNQGWDSLSLLYIHEIMSFVKYGFIKDLTQRAAILELLSRLSQRQELDEEASRFFTVLQANQDLRGMKLALN